MFLLKNKINETMHFFQNQGTESTCKSPRKRGEICYTVYTRQNNRPIFVRNFSLTITFGQSNCISSTTMRVCLLWTEKRPKQKQTKNWSTLHSLVYDVVYFSLFFHCGPKLWNLNCSQYYQSKRKLWREETVKINPEES